MTSRQWLQYFTERLVRHLSAEVVLLPPTRIHVDATETGGYYATIGRLSGRKYSGIELWLDAWTHTQRLYYGLSSSDDELMLTIRSGAYARLRPALQLSGTDVRNDGRYARLAVPLPPTALNKPVFESYKPYSFHGFYASHRIEGLISSGRISRQLLGDVMSGVVVLARTAHGILTAHSSVQSAVEEKQKRHAKIESWLRKHKLALQCKQRDGFTCRVCRFHAPSMYKSVPGTVAVEAHHLRHLGDVDDVKVTTKVDDLVTLCANCHSVVHQLGCTPKQLTNRLLLRR